jgi:hypothetical protein
MEYYAAKKAMCACRQNNYIIRLYMICIRHRYCDLHKNGDKKIRLVEYYAAIKKGCAHVNKTDEIDDRWIDVKTGKVISFFVPF